MAGANGKVIYSYFNNNKASQGGSIYWVGANGSLIGCTFINNAAGMAGAVLWNAHFGTISNSTFIHNSANLGGAIHWYSGDNSIITGCTFNNNTSTDTNGGAVVWGGNNGIITNSNFTTNVATSFGGAIYGYGVNTNVNSCNFNSNSAVNGSAINWLVELSMMDNTFINSKSQSYNGIYTTNNLNINGGNGIVYIYVREILSGISIISLNNQTYFCPPQNENINLPNKKEKIVIIRRYKIINSCYKHPRGK